MKTIQNILLAFVALAGMSCNDFLAEKPSKTSSIVPETTDHLEYILNNYSTFSEEANQTAIVSSDDYGLYTELYDHRNATYDIQTVQFATWDIENVANQSSDQFWSNEYKKIFAANMVLDNLSSVSGEAEIKEQLRMESHFIRAYSLWELANTYCLPYTEANRNELGLVLKQTTSFDESVERSTLERTYEQIERDLSVALQMTTELTMVNGKYKIWRASRPAVLAFAARYWLFRNDYEQAESYADAALELHNELVDYNTEMRYSNQKTTYTINPGTPEEEVVEVLFPYTHDDREDVTDRLEWKEFYWYRLLYNSSWWYVPSRELIALYDPQYDLRYRYHMVTNYSYAKGLTKPAYEYPGWVFFYDDCLPSGPTVAEMILIKAECQARQGNFIEAMNTVNILRAKRMDANAGAEIINLSATSKEEAIRQILEERRREMPFTMRWFDIRRLNNNEDTNDDVELSRKFYPYTSSSIRGNEAPVTYTLPKNSRRFAQPILSSEIESSQGRIQQNTY